MLELLAEILEHPDDDGLRQVYADRLLERGEPRGELIQVQVALAQTAEDDPAWAPLRRRELALLAKHEATWIEPLGNQLRGRFRRGFVEHLQGHVDYLVRRGPAILAAEPVTSLEPTMLTAHRIEELVASPLLARIRELRFVTGGGIGRNLPTLIERGELDQLTGLALAQNDLRGELIAALAASPLGARLRALDISHCILEPGDVRLVADGRFAALERLALAGSGLFVAALREAEVWQLPALRALDVSGIPLAEAEVSTLVRRMPGLEELRASRCQFGARGLELIARGVPGLRRLIAGDNNAVSRAAMTALAAMGDLEQLELGGPRHGVRVDLASFAAGWPRLRRLGLAGFELDHGELLAGDGPLQRLTSLDLSNTSLDDDGVRAITDGRWPALHTLILRGNRELSHHAARLLAEAEHLPALVHLDLRDSGIVERGRKALRARYRSGLEI